MLLLIAVVFCVWMFVSVITALLFGAFIREGMRDR